MGLVSPVLAQPDRTIPKALTRVCQEVLTPSLVRILTDPRLDPYRAQLQRKVITAQLNREMTKRIFLEINPREYWNSLSKSSIALPSSGGRRVGRLAAPAARNTRLLAIQVLSRRGNPEGSRRLGAKPARSSTYTDDTCAP